LIGTVISPGSRPMQHLLFFIVVVLAVAVAAPRFLQHTEQGAVTIARATPEGSNSRTVSVSRGDNGHFSIDGLVDGRRLNFLVDTGASMIALRESDAARLGVHPAPREYTLRISTANGVIKAAPIELNRVEVGDLLVRNVSAVVLPDEALGQNLLGMSFLSRVHWQYQGSKLVLEQ
jgi:aspartyl protease family protein